MVNSVANFDGSLVQSQERKLVKQSVFLVVCSF